MRRDLFQKLQQKYQHSTPNKKWLRRICATGFIFFLIKGLAWTAAAAWVVYQTTKQQILL